MLASVKSNIFLGAQYFKYTCYFRMPNRKFEKMARKGCAKNKVSIDNRLVDCVVEHWTPRAEKILSALLDAGMKVHIFHFSRNFEGTDFFTRCRGQYRLTSVKNIKELANSIYHDNAIAIHWFTSWELSYKASILVKNKNLFPPIIVERYDILCELYNSNSKSMNLSKQIEKYIFRIADGICAREFGLDFLEKKGYRLSRHRIVFMDNIVKMALPKHKENKEELHFCYVGGIRPEKNYPDSIFACNIDVAKHLASHHCHYHMFSSAWDEDAFRELVDYDKHNYYFHIHKPMPHGKLIEELSKCDYGILPAKKFTKEDWIDSDYTFDKIIYAASNKFFDYYSAGLPIISELPKILMDKLSEHGVVIKWNYQDIDFSYLKKHKTELKEKVVEKRDYWLMENRIGELISFYGKVSRDCKRNWQE